MGRKGNWVRKILYKNLSLESYLYLLSKFYFISFNSGLLKKNPQYAYPYFLKNIVHKGDVCIDIGANLGYLTVLFSRLVGNSGKVFSVEPVKPVLSVLRRNTKKLVNVEIFPFALGEENKTIQLGNNTIHEKGFMASGSHTVLKAGASTDITFDAEMKKGSELFSQIDKLDFIKCDIEGYEDVVIPELKPVIVKHRPMLLIETSGDNRKKLLHFFAEHEFNSYVLSGDFLYPAKEEDSTDILVIPAEKIDSIKKYLIKSDN